MSDKMTSVNLGGHGRGFGCAEWGSVPVEEMIEILRIRARKCRDWADDVLSAKDEDFRVESYYGPNARRGLVVIQEGRV